MSAIEIPAIDESISKHHWQVKCPSGFVHRFSVDAQDLTDRLKPEGVALEAPLEVDVAFDGEKLRLALSTELSYPCGRCLEPIRQPLSRSMAYALFDSALEADEALDLEDDDHETLSSEDGATLIGLVGDELLIAVTEAPTHPACNPPAHAKGSEERLRPFAGLAGLLRGGTKDENR